MYPTLVRSLAFIPVVLNYALLISPNNPFPSKEVSASPTCETKQDTYGAVLAERGVVQVDVTADDVQLHSQENHQHAGAVHSHNAAGETLGTQQRDCQRWETRGSQGQTVLSKTQKC